MKSSIQDMYGINESITSRLTRLLLDGNHRFQQHARKGILLFGDLSVGKSTLAHALSGRKLQAVLDEETNEIVIKSTEPLDDIVIEHNVSFESKVPNKCLVGELSIWELPGLDNTDPVEEIAHRFYVRKIFEIMEEMKFVLVVSASDLKSKQGNKFLETLSNFAKIFKDIRCANGSVSLVITKVAQRKDVLHIQNAIRYILMHNRGATDALKALTTEMFSEMYLFREPNEGDVVELPDLLRSIDSFGIYSIVNEHMVSTHVSKTSKGISSYLLKMTRKNFFHIVEVIAEAIFFASDCLTINEGNVLWKHHSVIADWVPLSLRYNIQQEVQDEYFRELELLSKLIHAIPDYEVCDVSEAIKIFLQVLDLFSEYVEHSLYFCVQDYAYCLQQQHEYVKFFTILCEVEQLDYSKVFKLLKSCREKAEENLYFSVLILRIDKDKVDDGYYFKAIQFLENFQDVPACIRQMAVAYRRLGVLMRQKDRCSSMIYTLRSAKAYCTAVWKMLLQFVCRC